MAIENGAAHSSPSWFISPGESDPLAWITIGLLLLGLFGIVTLYAAFDRWAEHKSSGTPLAKTIPTLLMIALLYEIFPLDHFNILLPISAILIALLADWSRFHSLSGIIPTPEPAESKIPDSDDDTSAETASVDNV